MPRQPRTGFLAPPAPTSRPPETGMRFRLRESGYWMATEEQLWSFPLRPVETARRLGWLHGPGSSPEASRARLVRTGEK